MRVLICGDRNWDDYVAVRDTLKVFKETSEVSCVIEGEAYGADSHGRAAAEELGIPVEPYPADWKKYGKGAGPIRNQQMLDEGKPDLVLAFHDKLQESKGTKDMVLRSQKAGIKTINYYHILGRTEFV